MSSHSSSKSKPNPRPQAQARPTSSTLPTSRLPAPSLFVGPPSRNASNLSLAAHNPSSRQSPTSATADSSTNNRQPGAFGSSPTKSSKTTTPISAGTRGGKNHNGSADPSVSSTEGAAGTNTDRGTAAVPSIDVNNFPAKPRPSNQQLDAQWADLQSTLADIELSANFDAGGGGGGGDAGGIDGLGVEGAGAGGVGQGVGMGIGGRAHVFGANHASALDELRKAQIALAKAWGPGPASGLGEQGKDKNDKEAEAAGTRKRAESTGASQASGKGVGGGGGSEEAADLGKASKRREANEKYFAEVKAGVQDVVARLDAVSAAMRKVEMESREIWGDGESLVSVDTRGTG